MYYPTGGNGLAAGMLKTHSIHHRYNMKTKYKTGHRYNNATVTAQCSARPLHVKTNDKQMTGCRRCTVQSFVQIKPSNCSANDRVFDLFRPLSWRSISSTWRWKLKLTLLEQTSMAQAFLRTCQSTRSKSYCVLYSKIRASCIYLSIWFVFLFVSFFNRVQHRQWGISLKCKCKNCN